MPLPIDLIVQLVSGAIAGNLPGLASRNINLGWIWNTLLGLAGGAGGGQLLGPILAPMLGVTAAAAKTGMDPMAILTSVIAGGGSGLVVTALGGGVKSLLVKTPA